MNFFSQSNNLCLSQEKLREYIITTLKLSSFELNNCEPKVCNKNLFFGGSINKKDFIELSESLIAPRLLVELSKIVIKNIDQEGLFRKSGSCPRQSQIQKYVNKENEIPHNISFNVFDACCLIKLFFAKLPEPIFPRCLWKLFLLVYKRVRFSENLEIEKQNAIYLYLTFLLLPYENICTLRFTFDFLNQVSQHVSKNKMSAENLATVMTPNLLQDINSLSWKEFVPWIKIITCFIENSDKLGYIPEDIYALCCNNSESEDALIDLNDDKNCRTVPSLYPNISKAGSNSVQRIPYSDRQSKKGHRRSGSLVNGLRHGLKKMVVNAAYIDPHHMQDSNYMKQIANSPCTPHHHITPHYKPKSPSAPNLYPNKKLNGGPQSVENAFNGIEQEQETRLHQFFVEKTPQPIQNTHSLFKKTANTTTSKATKDIIKSSQKYESPFTRSGNMFLSKRNKLQSKGKVNSLSQETLTHLVERNDALNAQNHLVASLPRLNCKQLTNTGAGKSKKILPKGVSGVRKLFYKLASMDKTTKPYQASSHVLEYEMQNIEIPNDINAQAPTLYPKLIDESNQIIQTENVEQNINNDKCEPDIDDVPIKVTHRKVPCRKNPRIAARNYSKCNLVCPKKPPIIPKSEPNQTNDVPTDPLPFDTEDDRMSAMNDITNYTALFNYCDRKSLSCSQLPGLNDGEHLKLSIDSILSDGNDKQMMNGEESPNLNQSSLSNQNSQTQNVLEDDEVFIDAKLAFDSNFNDVKYVKPKENVSSINEVYKPSPTYKTARRLLKKALIHQEIAQRKSLTSQDIENNLHSNILTPTENVYETIAEESKTDNQNIEKGSPMYKNDITSTHGIESPEKANICHKRKRTLLRGRPNSLKCGLNPYRLIHAVEDDRKNLENEMILSTRMDSDLRSKKSKNLYVSMANIPPYSNVKLDIYMDNHKNKMLDDRGMLKRPKFVSSLNQNVKSPNTESMTSTEPQNASESVAERIRRFNEIIRQQNEPRKIAIVANKDLKPNKSKDM